ncbi:SIGNR1 alpha [Sigmodon hispidus]
MSDSTGARMQPLGSVEDEEWMISGTRCSSKSSRLQSNSGIKNVAGCLGHGQITVVLQLLSFLFLAGLLLIVLVQVSKTANTRGQEESKQEDIYQELTQLTDKLSSMIPISQGQNESMQKISEQVMQLKTELLSMISIFQRQNESMQEKISEQLMQLKAELFSRIPTFLVQTDSKQERIFQQLVQMKAELSRLCRPCPWDWTFLLGNCYFFSKSQRNWNNAIQACQEVEAELVIIESDEEQTFLQQTSKAKGLTWMGLSDLKKEATWLWVDGSPLSSRFQKYWNKGEPNNIGEEDCVEFAGDGWNDSKCELQKFWICKKSAIPCLNNNKKYLGNSPEDGDPGETDEEVGGESLRHRCNPLVLQLLSFLFLAGLLLIVLILVSKVPSSQGQDKIYKELMQLKTEVHDGLCQPCPRDWVFFNGKCYFFSKSQRNWYDSITACKEMGAQLVIIETDEEQSFLQQTSKVKGPTWMGLSDLHNEATWHWVDGSSLSPSFVQYWNRGEPNNVGEEDCAEFSGDGWNDLKCDALRFWICKKALTSSSLGVEASQNAGRRALRCKALPLSLFSSLTSTLLSRQSDSSFEKENARAQVPDHQAARGYRPLQLRDCQGHRFLGRGRYPLMLQLLLLILFAGLMVAVIIQVSKIPSSEEVQWEQTKQEKMYWELSQLKSEVDSLCRLCPWDWTFFNGNCYFFSKSQRDWHSSITACQDVGAQLVVIRSHEEQSFLQQTSKKNGYTWMGLSDLNKEGAWYWLDGSPLSDSFEKYWLKGQPNNIDGQDCVEFRDDGWNDAKCDSMKLWICKKSATTCSIK